MELLVVIVVLGVLAATVVFALGSVASQSVEAACTSDASTVETAVTAYNAANGGSAPVTPALLTTGNPQYLHTFPSSPDYAITIVNGTVMIAAPKTATPVPYGTPNACGNAGGSPGTPDADQAIATTTTTAPAAPTTTTTTTAPPPTTTTTTPPTTTTTTVPVSNGVAATPSSSNYSYYGGQERVSLTNTKAITALTITIEVAQTTGITEDNIFNSFPGDAGTENWSAGGGKITYTYVLSSGHTIPASSGGQLGAQWNGTGSPRVTSGDTWSVVSTSDGKSSTLSGTF